MSDPTRAYHGLSVHGRRKKNTQKTEYAVDNNGQIACTAKFIPTIWRTI